MDEIPLFKKQVQYTEILELIGWIVISFAMKKFVQFLKFYTLNPGLIECQIPLVKLSMKKKPLNFNVLTTK